MVLHVVALFWMCGRPTVAQYNFSTPPSVMINLFLLYVQLS